MVTVQMYAKKRQIRGFVGALLIFDANEVTWQTLDALGLPRLGEGSAWEKTDWGHEITVEFSARLTKPKPIICPTCKQDMREGPREGKRRCLQCGQAIKKSRPSGDR